MWTAKTQRSLAFRLTAATVTSLWILAATLCALRCAGAFELSHEKTGGRACCHRDVSAPTSVSQTEAPTSATTVPSPGKPISTASCECLKACLDSKSIGLGIQTTSGFSPMVTLTEVRWIGLGPTDARSVPEVTPHDPEDTGSPASRRGPGLRDLAPPAA